MNNNMWHMLLVTIIICTYYNTQAAADTEFPVISSITSITKLSKLWDVPEKFQFSDDVIIEFFDQWSGKDRTNNSATPLQVTLNGDRLAIFMHWKGVNRISPLDQVSLYWQVDKSLQFPPAQATRIIEHLLSTKKASANEEYEGLDKGNTPLHSARHPEHVATLIKYGANLTARNRVGNTPFEEALQLASINRIDVQTIEALLKGGAPTITEHRFHCIMFGPISEKKLLEKVAPLQILSDVEIFLTPPKAQTTYQIQKQ